MTMKKNELKEKVEKRISETHDAINTIIESLNSGQRKKICKNKKVKELLERYDVEVEE